MITTKELVDLKILDQHGYVETYSIQKHIPSENMFLLRLKCDQYLAAQENHPITVLREGVGEVTVEIRYINIQTDQIWFDNTFLFDEVDEANRILPSESPYTIIKQIRSVNFGEIERADFKYVKGERHNYRLHPKFYFFDKSFLNEILEETKDLFIFSYNFISQLQMIRHILEGKMYKGYYPIRTITCFNYGYPVFDIKTSTQHFLLNGVRTHNSFHTGGAVELKIVDIIDEIMTNVDNIYLDKIKSFLKQIDNDLYLTTDFAMIRLNKDIYNIKKYQEDADKYILPVGYFELSFRDLKIDVHIEQETILYKSKSEEIEENDESITLLYGKGEKLISVYPMMKDYPKMANTLEGIFSGNSPWTTPESLYMKIMKVFGFEEPWDSVHMEVLLSNLLRNRRDPHQLARLKEPYEPVLIPFKQVPGMISWPLSLAFENFSSAIQIGMISDRGEPSPIEKVMIGEGLVEEV